MRIRHVSPIEVIAHGQGLPVSDRCTEQVATIVYDSDFLCAGCVTELADAGEPVAQYGQQITPRH